MKKNVVLAGNRGEISHQQAKLLLTLHSNMCGGGLQEQNHNHLQTLLSQESLPSLLPTARFLRLIILSVNPSTMVLVVVVKK